MRKDSGVSGVNYHDHPDHPSRAPFGLETDVVQGAWEESQDRPKGAKRYMSFATKLEEAVGAESLGDGAQLQAMALAQAYGRLLHHARAMQTALARTINTVNHYGQGRFDTVADQEALDRFVQEYGCLD